MSPDHPKPLTGRCALVTGGTRGIGFAVAATLVDRGADVVITSRADDRAREAASRLGPRVLGVGAHATDEAAAHACVARAVEAYGKVDILVNNAGGNATFGPLTEIAHDAFFKTVSINLWAPLLWSGAVWHASMRDHGGVIVNVASIGGMATGPGTGAYRVSKAGLIHLTRQLAFEMAPKVRVNAVAPGLVRTEMARALWEPDEDAATRRILLGRIGMPQDISGAVAFLASDEAAWLTGETLVVDGGQLIAHSASAPAR